MEGRFVAYYRVSTDKQGRSGLGLEAQRQAVTDYLNGGRWQLVGASTRSDSEIPHDLLGPVYSHHFASMLRHVERVTNDTKSI